MLSGTVAAALLHATLLAAGAPATGPGPAPAVGPAPVRTAAPPPGAAGTPASAPAADTLEVPAPPPDWQQEVAYAVEARLDEDEEVLEAAQVVRYRNASPDTLRQLYFHLYLNAFRPNSVWARNERRERLPFDTLSAPNHGFERLRSVRLLSGPGAGAAGTPAPPEDGRELTPRYPHAPDSTVVRLELPEPLAPGAELTLRMRWDARPATLCRRQCREGRSWDFAQWYPRVAVYDGTGWNDHPLYPQGEFYGEFATYDVTLELAEDQVVGATGVPVEGDPGWEPGPGSPAEEPLYQRDFYGEDPSKGVGPDPGLLAEEPGEGRRRVRFHAEHVHHFAWSTSPEYRWEGAVWERGLLPDVAIHVLYRPGDSTWTDGVAVERSIRALSWLETVFRPYPYPQFTNLHRLEGGGTEFPMLVMDGSASEGLIVHEATHQYAHGILGNNEWKEAWLDEGLTSFLDTWYAEEHGGDPWDGFMTGVGRVDGMLHDPAVRRSPPSRLSGFAVEGDTLPVPMPIARRSETFPNYTWYGFLSYTRPQAVFYMLRQMLGKETTRRILRTYYDRNRYRHVNEGELRAVAEEVSGRELDWFFDQWLQRSATLDWAVRGIEVTGADGGDGGWTSTVTLHRAGEAWMPVTLRLTGPEGRTKDVRVDTRDRTVTVEVDTAFEPAAAEVDPQQELLDADPSNDRREVGGSGGDGGAAGGGAGDGGGDGGPRR